MVFTTHLVQKNKFSQIVTHEAFHTDGIYLTNIHSKNLMWIFPDYLRKQPCKLTDNIVKIIANKILV